ncbi:hypothetical protein SAMD00023353_10500040 [Rosellinia necatrix]|uniref:Uncharacterized protein n=1 Tax=Rosellinia necatrix TaxID=77044 RepID=A0A1S8ACB6_ROSNE|nr:hypothetical protein SAMD00023353_10500040 [Rosellinia necatrix]
MKLTAALYSLVAVAGVLAQSDEYPPLKTEGPYALHVKGRGNSTIDGESCAASLNAQETLC